jgi:hypothetical protein
MENFFKEILAGIEWIGEELAAFGSAVETFLGIAGPAGLKLATDIAADVAAGGVTPVVAATQLADLAAFARAIQQAAATGKAPAPVEVVTTVLP